MKDYVQTACVKYIAVLRKRIMNAVLRLAKELLNRKWAEIHNEFHVIKATVVPMVMWKERIRKSFRFIFVLVNTEHF